MRQSLTLSIALLFSLVLSACGGPDTETAVPPESDPIDEEREAALERMEEIESAPPAPTRDRAPGSGVDAAPEASADVRLDPARMAPPPVEGDLPAIEEDVLVSDDDQEVHWWDDEELAGKLGLEPEQRVRLLEAREALHNARVEGRARIIEQRDLEAEFAGDAQRLAELRESAVRIETELEAAEATWQETVRSTLTPEQYAHLADLIED